MCGIFAYIGERNNAPELLIEGLKKLEYRGYDSWGIAYKKGPNLVVHKEIGKIGDFDSKNLDMSSIGIGETEEDLFVAISHTRWATHGGIHEKNAHPHTSASGEIVIVHNGVLENFDQLKKKLKKDGHKFKSETDTEVIAHLIETYLEDGKTLREAVTKTIEELEGRYAFVVINKTEDIVIGARRGSPLIVGKGDDEFFVASDIPPFLKYTNKVLYIDDNELVEIKKKDINFFNISSGEKVEKRIVEIDLTEESTEKGEFPHFLIKEIMDQKESIQRAINQDNKLIEKAAKAIKGAFGTYFIGCGTTGKVAMVGEYLFAEIAHRHVNTTFGSEFSNYKHFIRDKSLLIAISQSGETADTLEAIEMAQKKKAKIMSIVNVESSTMARISDIVIPIKAGVEKAVVSTKATTAQIAILTLLAYACDGGVEKGKKLLIDTVSQINDMLNPRYEEHIEKLAEKLKEVESMYLIGRGKNYPIALEGAIKIQEVSYIHAEGFAGGELKHGPIALISEGTPCVALVANDESKNETISNAIELKARGAYIIGVAPENNEVFDYWIKVPDVSHASPIVNIIPIQILAYKLAVLRKNDPDKPRNLAKSVTVK
ncbi:glutamine--fructose-6-phosphate transaminase (isomerizing) [Candidatus Peregrinibacteria bacterium]|jgi:glutamine---fructose-6-phosphate transaminase (isomerizing)|nr:glutamine--fructose-6-phosphate transaminase (isomerizing) [Candidatus Peregrinibacteria bacterium]MBT4148187.1 glutamine--fructose-6-phosphate transaminase (isomerizing) [Candidatus Peregrinibacteria bacterium]MBT4365898.1 glutamine--fructose-6-phosphate transaminase (isomerizing) [Candidatus Peregrinibacteria bacterium]MBT4455661.1 glutamine--fructose-6-phosphate transaminase (isomerizing) [Candidatus Peregrinibacteria bacterium]